MSTVSKYQEFLDANRSKLLAYFLIASVTGQSNGLESPDPVVTLNEEQLEALKAKLDECMPCDSMIIDLWDWDLHFEEELGDDWYFSAVFGDEGSLDSCSEALAEFFHGSCQEYNIDYNQVSSDDPDFIELVDGESRKFIACWRSRVIEKYAAQESQAVR